MRIQGRTFASTILTAGTLAAFAVIGASSSPAASFSMKQCLKSGKTEVECQCARAIGLGTRTALKKFITTYGRTDTACNAAASSAGLRIPQGPVITEPPVVTRVKNNRGLGNADELNGCGSGCTDLDNPAHGTVGVSPGGGSSGGGSSGGGNSSSGGNNGNN